MTFPPPNTTSSPYFVKSFSTLMNKSVSAKRTESPVVGPYICAYCSLDIRKLMNDPRLLVVRPLHYEIHILLFHLHNQLVEPLFHLQAQNELLHLLEYLIFFHMPFLYQRIMLHSLHKNGNGNLLELACPLY